MKKRITDSARNLVCGLILDWRLAAHRLAEEALHSKHSEHSLAAIAADQTSAFEGYDREGAFLVRMLRRFPYWRAGHLALAENAFCRREFGLAYGSAQAVLTLQPSRSFEGRALHILGRCCLASGAEKRAIEFFEKAENRNPDTLSIREDLAAAYAAAGEKERAIAILSEIPAEKISQEGKTALAALRRGPASN